MDCGEDQSGSFAGAPGGGVGLPDCLGRRMEIPPAGGYTLMLQYWSRRPAGVVGFVAV